MTETGRLRLLFLGSGELGLPTLDLLSQRHELAAVITQPDRPAGRKRKLRPTPVAEWAGRTACHTIKADNVNEPEMVRRITDLGADAAVVIAFGQKLSPELLDGAGRLAVNLHASLLPRYRGAAPINWAIIKGETQTGVSVIGLAQRMDAGLIYARSRTPIDPRETAGELHDRLARLGPDAVMDVLDRFAAGALEGQSQDDAQATRAPKLSKADAWLDLTAPARDIRCRIHGLTPWPGVQVEWQPRDPQRSPMRLALYRVSDMPDFEHDQSPGTILPGNLLAVGDGAIRILEVHPPGKRVMTFRQFTNGHPVAPGDRFEPVTPKPQ